MADKPPGWIHQEEHIDHQLVRGIGIPALTANIVSSTIGAGIFVIPAAVAKGLGSAAPLAFICCAIAMVLFVTCFAIAGSRVSLTGGLYAYVEVAFGRYVGFLAGMLYFLTALGAVAGVVNVLANSVALVVPFLGSPVMRIVVMLAVYGSLVCINIRGVREGAGAVTVITVAKLLPLLLFICVGLFFIHPPNLSWPAWPGSKPLGDAVILLIFAFGRDGALPKWFAHVHPRYRSPDVAIITYAVLAFALSVTGTFEKLAVLSNVAVLLMYLLCCAACWVLVQRDVRADGAQPFNFPGMNIVPVLAIVAILWILVHATAREFVVTGVVLAVASVVYLVRGQVRRKA